MLPLATVAAQRPTSLAGRSVVYAPHGIVSTSQPLATTAGLAVLQRGGNAIDAAGTAGAGLTRPEPMVVGIGGGLFSLGWVAKEHRLLRLEGHRGGRVARTPRGLPAPT